MKHIFGLWRDARGYRAAHGHLHLRLNQDAVVPATNQAIPRDVEFALDGNGALPSGSQAWANDELLPTGTYYVASVTAAGGGLVWGPQNVYISGADPVDLNLLVPLPGIAAIEALAASAGQSVVFTRPPLQAGVLGARVSDLTTWAPSSFVTVSDQFVLAGASGVSIIASKSLDSLTASIAVSIDSENFAVFSAAALGNTATNQIVLAGGSNLSLATSSDSQGMTVAFDVSADIDVVQNPLTLAAGSNITLASSGNVAGTTITINAGGGTGTGGGAVTIVPGANIGVTQNTNIAGTTVTISASGATNTAGRSVSLITGANISITSGTNTAGSSFTIAGASGGTAAGGNFTAGIAGGNTSGAGSTVTNQFLLAGGSNITLSRTTNASGMTVSIIGLSQGTGTGTAAGGVEVGIAAVGPGSIVGAATGSTIVTNRLMFVPANNITFYSNTGPQDMSLFISAAGGQMAQVGIVNAGGSTAGNLTGSIRPAQWNLQAGPNITLSAQTDVLSNLNLLIQGGAGGTGPAGTFHAGISGGNTSGQTAIVSNSLMLAGGPNITLSGSTNAQGLTVSISGASGGGTGTGSPPFNLGLLAAGGGSAAGVTATRLMTDAMRLVAGSNVTLSGTTNTAGYTVSIRAWDKLRFALNSGGEGTVNTLVAADIGNLRLVAGSNIGLTNATDSVGATVTIAAAGGAGAPFLAGIHTSLESLTTLGTQWGSTIGNVGPMSNGLSLAAGPQITLVGETNQSGQMITIRAPKPFSAVASSAAGGGSFAGATFNITNGLLLYPGSNITFSGNQTATLGNGALTIIGPSAYFNAMVSGGGAGSTQGVSAALESGIRLQAGSNITLSASSNTNRVLFVTINAAGGGTGTGTSTTTAADNRYFGVPLPIVPMLTAQTTFVHNSVIFWPFQMLVQNSNFTAAILPLYMAMPNTGTHRGGLGISLGVYTRTGSTLSQAGSVNYTTSWSTNSLPIAFLGGWRLVNIPWSHSFAPDKDHWLAMRLTSSSSYQSFNISGLNYQQPGIVGFIGNTSADPLIDAVPGWGIYTGNSLPSSVAFSAIASEPADPFVNTPMLYFAGFTT